MRKIFYLFVCTSIFFLCWDGFSSSFSEISNSNIRQGYEAFRDENWNSASFFLRKAFSSPENVTDENYFMLIKSEIYSGEYKMAEEDCDDFLLKFPFSIYVSHILYQKGRLLHLLGKNDDAVIVLGDFCKNHYDDELYPLALFWIAESFYDEYNFDIARGLYDRIVSGFPDCEKTKDSQYKLDLIAQRAREEKLLYLLKTIGEENLSTREEYERQIKIYQMNDRNRVEAEITGLNSKISELEAALANKKTDSFMNAEAATALPSQPSSDSNSDEESKSVVESGSVQFVNEPSLHIRKKSAADQNFEKLKRKAEQIPYVLENQDTDGEK